jgi:chemotaxis protein MotB
MASSKLFVPEDPQSPLNRRISIIVMNRDAEERLLKLSPGQGDADLAAAAEAALGNPLPPPLPGR